jgi:DNA-binding HxlR family transcriptional regulator
MALLDLLGRRWTLRIMWELRDSTPQTFRALQALCEDVSSSVLTTRLRELNEANLVTHEGDGYVLTDQGASLLSHLRPLDTWATNWAASISRR